MEKLLARVVLTFTTGFLVIGVVLGLQGVGDCGSAFNPSGACADGALAGHLALVIAFLGLGLTGLSAAVVIDISRNSEKQADPEPEDLEQEPDQHG